MLGVPDLLCLMINRPDCLLVKISTQTIPVTFHTQIPGQEDEGAPAPAQPGQCQHSDVRGGGGREDSDREVQRQGPLLSGPPPQQGRCLGQETQQLRPQLQRKSQSGEIISIIVRVQNYKSIYLS